MEISPETPDQEQEPTLPRREPVSLGSGDSREPAPAPAKSPSRLGAWLRGRDWQSGLISIGIPVVAGLGLVGVLAWWMMSDRAPTYAPGSASSVPQRAYAGQTAEPTPAGGTPPQIFGQPGQPAAPGQPGASAPAGTPAPRPPPPAAGGGGVQVSGQWPRFRGANLDNIADGPFNLARTWPAAGPKVLWQINLGEGHAGPAVANGKVYVLDYDEPAQSDVLRCFSLSDGRELWHSGYKSPVKRNHGMSRTVPTISGNYVVTMGPMTVVTCWDATNGKIQWQIDLLKRYGATLPEWYSGQCPLVDNGKVIIASGGSAALLAVDLASGKVVWQTADGRHVDMSHSSILPTTFAGKRLYLECFKEGLIGVDAANGKVLFFTEEWRVSTATIPMPIPLGEGKFFITGGYNAGSVFLQLQKSGDKIVPKITQRLPATVFSSDQHTPVLYKGYLYGVVSSKELVCLDLSGKQVWSSGPQNRYGLGPYLISNGLIYVLSDQGVLNLIEASPQGFRKLASAKLLNGPEAYGPLALVGGVLLARDLTRMICLDVRG